MVSSTQLDKSCSTSLNITETNLVILKQALDNNMDRPQRTQRSNSRASFTVDIPHDATGIEFSGTLTIHSPNRVRQDPVAIPDGLQAQNPVDDPSPPNRQHRPEFWDIVMNRRIQGDSHAEGEEAPIQYAPNEGGSTLGTPKRNKPKKAHERHPAGESQSDESSEEDDLPLIEVMRRRRSSLASPEAGVAAPPSLGSGIAVPGACRLPGLGAVTPLYDHDPAIDAGNQAAGSLEDGEIEEGEIVEDDELEEGEMIESDDEDLYSHEEDAGPQKPQCAANRELASHHGSEKKDRPQRGFSRPRWKPAEDALLVYAWRTGVSFQGMVDQNMFPGRNVTSKRLEARIRKLKNLKRLRLANGRWEFSK